MKTLIVIACLILLGTAQADAARLVWNASTGTVEGYRAYWTDLATQTEYSRTLPPTPTEMQLTEARLEPGKSYRFALTAFNRAGESGRSNTVDWTQPMYAPPPDLLPPVVIVIPGASTTIRIDP